MEHMLDNDEILEEIEKAKIFLRGRNPDAGDWICTEMIFVKCLASVYYWRSVAMGRSRVLSRVKEKEVEDVQG